MPEVLVSGRFGGDVVCIYPQFDSGRFSAASVWNVTADVEQGRPVHVITLMCASDVARYNGAKADCKEMYQCTICTRVASVHHLHVDNMRIGRPVDAMPYVFFPNPATYWFTRTPRLPALPPTNLRHFLAACVLLLLPNLLRIHNDQPLPLHPPALGETDQLLNLPQAMERIAIHRDPMLGDELQHVAGFLRAGDETAADADVAEYQLLEGDGDILGLCDLLAM